jgi:hypothetical protein
MVSIHFLMLWCLIVLVVLTAARDGSHLAQSRECEFGWREAALASTNHIRE